MTWEESLINEIDRKNERIAFLEKPLFKVVIDHSQYYYGGEWFDFYVRADNHTVAQYLAVLVFEEQAYDCGGFSIKSYLIADIEQFLNEEFGGHRDQHQ